MEILYNWKVAKIIDHEKFIMENPPQEDHFKFFIELVLICCVGSGEIGRILVPNGEDVYATVFAQEENQLLPPPESTALSSEPSEQ